MDIGVNSNPDGQDWGIKSIIKLAKDGLSYSLKRDSRSISKIIFYANLRVSPIDTELL